MPYVTWVLLVVVALQAGFWRSGGGIVILGGPLSIWGWESEDCDVKGWWCDGIFWAGREASR
jgi:hypothetical protein